MFQLGNTLITSKALAVCTDHGIDPLIMLSRHYNHDWGDLCNSDKLLNDQAVTNGDRILSKYIVNGQKFYIVTEWDRSATTIMLVADY